ncbi:Transcriptional regulatory protein CusR [Phycisphaerae bacterium RAS1]|nr:Transcriptional regulatory protein CusR [Phycisphaerae bacterium RAS1]
MKLLVAEDDALLGRALLKGLREADYAVDWARDGDEAAHLLRTGDYDGVVLDWMLPRLSGLELLRRHRAAGGKTPVLMLTARDTSGDTVAGLDAGADDYLVKPFEFSVLLARLRALVRRRYDAASSVIRVADLEVDLARREVRRAGQPIALTAREFTLLELLALRVDHVVSRTEIWNKLYETDDPGTSNTVDVYIAYLRRKIDRGRRPLIVTRRGQGYMLRGDSCGHPSDDGSPR